MLTRPAVAEVDLSAVAANVATLRDVAGGAQLCAVVKADGYGHGAVRVARAAVGAGATWLAVATVEEGRELREAGLDAPVLLLSEPVPSAMGAALEHGLTPTVYTPEGIAAASSAASARDGGPWPVHLKVDTGMHRVGASPADAAALARAIDDDPALALGGTSTHLAVADEPQRPETDEQVDLYDRVLDQLADLGIDPGLRHVANSAGAIAHPRSRRDLVRVGIALYGIPPSPQMAGSVPLRPALSLRSRVTLTRRLRAGEGISYGLRHVVERDAEVAVVPLGYADGVPRNLGLAGGRVLIGGAHRPVRGAVTMDQMVVEVTDGPPVAVGDEVVLIGEQGGRSVTATEWAEALGTIAYEVVCGIAARVPRRELGEAR